MQNNQRTGVSTFASHTRPSTDQSLQKSFHLSHPDKIELKKSPPLLKIKKYATLNRHLMTEQLNNDNGLQTRWTKGLLITAVWRNGGGSGNINSCTSNKHLWLVDSEVLRKPPLRQAAKRYKQFYDDTANRQKRINLAFTLYCNSNVITLASSRIFC